MYDDIFARNFRTTSTIDSLLVYSSFSMLRYMPHLTVNDVQLVNARPWVSRVSTKFATTAFKVLQVVRSRLNEISADLWEAVARQQHIFCM